MTDKQDVQVTDNRYARKEGFIYDAFKDLGVAKTVLLGSQHAFTMFGATILVPILTGFDVSVALFMAGICTLAFHLITSGKIPVFMGSSFSFIAPVLSVVTLKGDTAFAQGGLIACGLIYLLMSILLHVFGIEKITNFFPPIVTGPIIISIGLKLAPTAIGMATDNWTLAAVSFLTVVAVNIYGKGMLRLIPVLIGVVVGYIAALILNVVDLTPVGEAAWFGVPNFTFPKFDVESMLMIAPVALVTIVEHIGDIIAISETAGSDFTTDPGFDRTMFGNGISTSLSALFGGPASTTYSENTGVLALTKVVDPRVMRIASVFAILLGAIPKLSALVGTIPTGVLGGVSIVLFGMIASVGLRSLVVSKVDLFSSKNQLTAAAILVLALGGDAVPGGMATASIVGILMNAILPDEKNA